MRTKVCYLFLAFINVVILQGSVASEERFDHCPEIWSEYVELVKELLASKENETPTVLFVGTGGAVHNCLGEPIELDTLQAVQEYETSLLVVFDGNIDGTAKDWPLNVCTTATTRLELLTYWKINLPYARPILLDAKCKYGVDDSINNVFERFERSHQ